MMNYNYYENVLEDVKEWIKDNIELSEYAEDRNGLEEYLNDTLWTEDSVTGNASGSYTFSTFKAEENLSHNWNLILQVAEEYGIEPTISDSYEHGAEWWDVTIRCYFLNRAISAALDELEDEGSISA